VSAYATYLLAGRAVGGLTALSLNKAEIRALQTNFDKFDKGKPCADIRSDILASTVLGQCPYCRLNDATTLDHILSKSTYPEYAVLRPNLAPCCSDCNTSKQATSWALAHRPLFHLYFHGFPAVSYLHVSVDVSPKGVRFRFDVRKPAAMSAPDFAVVETHFESVGLAARYERRASVEMREIAEYLQRMHQLRGVPAVQAYLRRLAGSKTRAWSQADWKSALLTAAADSPEFCNAGIFLL
jgi:hypothetical protein